MDESQENNCIENNITGGQEFVCKGHRRLSVTRNPSSKRQMYTSARDELFFCKWNAFSSQTSESHETFSGIQKLYPAMSPAQDSTSNSKVTSPSSRVQLAANRDKRTAIAMTGSIAVLLYVAQRTFLDLLLPGWRSEHLFVCIYAMVLVSQYFFLLRRTVYPTIYLCLLRHRLGYWPLEIGEIFSVEEEERGRKRTRYLEEGIPNAWDEEAEKRKCDELLKTQSLSTVLGIYRYMFLGNAVQDGASNSGQWRRFSPRIRLPDAIPGDFAFKSNKQENYPSNQV